MNKQDLKNIIEEAYYELLTETASKSAILPEEAYSLNETQLRALLAEMETQEFLDAVEDEFDLETLELMKGVIQKRITFLNKTLDIANPRNVVKGYAGHLTEAEGDEEEVPAEEAPETEFADAEAVAEEEADPTADILAKFPTLKKTLVHLLTADFEEFIEKVGWMSPKPSTFKVEFKNGQDIQLKWMGRGFQATVEGKRYFLNNLAEYQQCLDKIGAMLASGPITSQFDDAASGEDIFGGGEGGGGEFPGEEGGAGGFEGGEESGAEAGTETPAGEEDVFAGVEA